MSFKFEKHTQNKSKNKDQNTGPDYWRSIHEFVQDPSFKSWLHREFPEGASESESMDRRSFLKIAGAFAAFAGFGLSGCRQPKTHIMPYSKQPERIVPGVPIYYTTSMPSAYDNLPLIVETYDARPTKIEGNDSFQKYGGGTDAFAQASILGLYDPDRVRKSTSSTQGTLGQAAVYDLLKSVSIDYLANQGKGLAFLAEPSTSPSRERLVSLIQEKFPHAIWCEYTPVQQASVERVLEKAIGKRLRPDYDLEKAKRILSIDSDFIKNEPGSLGYARAFTQSRKLKTVEDASLMNRLYVVESNYTLTGGVADHRLRLPRSHMDAFVALLAIELIQLKGDAVPEILKDKVIGISLDSNWVKECAKDLFDHKGESLVMIGGDLSEATQLLVQVINDHLGAIGNTLSYLNLGERPYRIFTLEDLSHTINQGNVETLVVLGGNPVYDAPADLEWTKLQKTIKRVIRWGQGTDETSELSHYNIAASHYLESWADGRTWNGTLVPVQPMIMPLFETLSELEFLARISGLDNVDTYNIVAETVSALGVKNVDQWLAEGVNFECAYTQVCDVNIRFEDISTWIRDANWSAPILSAERLEFRFVPSSQVWDGRYNNNGWMQECPDAMTKLTWDNAVAISPRLAKELQEKSGLPIVPSPTLLNKKNEAAINANEFKSGKEIAFLAEVSANGKTIKGPLFIQPGLPDYSVILTLGYGRRKVGRVGQGTGFDVYPLITSKDAGFVLDGAITVTPEKYLLANTQEHWSMEGRDILREGNLDEFKKHPSFAKQMGMESHTPPVYRNEQNNSLQEKSTTQPRGESMYKTPTFTSPQQWGMSIDLNACTGCNACVVACQSENNVPYIGKDQVLRGREMHWIRLDRYYSSAQDDMTVIPEDPQVSFMSVMCQHCELAPCENVCPVNATVHDEQGLNVMAYNRCVGTRYCANNCQYKVRRFNFFDWNKRHIGHFYEGPLGPSDGVTQTERMQKNPNVTIRMRGVMEKCTYCVQRIEEEKIKQLSRAKDSSNIKVPDGAIQTACQQVCPTDAIVFGDVADPTTRVSQLKEYSRDYTVLGYLNTRPRTTYLARVRNPNKKMPDYKEMPLSRMQYEKRYGHGAHSEGHSVSDHGKAFHGNDSTHEANKPESHDAHASVNHGFYIESDNVHAVEHEKQESFMPKKKLTDLLES